MFLFVSSVLGCFVVCCRVFCLLVFFFHKLSQLLQYGVAILCIFNQEVTVLHAPVLLFSLSSLDQCLHYVSYSHFFHFQFFIDLFSLLSGVGPEEGH